jgi:hypothetical protein
MRTSWVRGLAAVAVALAFVAAATVGCDGDDQSAAERQCNALIDRICARMVVCGSMTSTSSCHSAMATYLPCASAVAVGPTYGTCLTDVDAIDCAAFATDTWLPASCNHVILM